MTPDEIWERYKAGQPLDAEIQVHDGKGEGADIIHRGAECFERKAGAPSWERLPWMGE